MRKSSFYLSKHVFLCLADNRYVFLDLRGDEYLCLGREHTDAMTDLLKEHQDVGARPIEGLSQGTEVPGSRPVVEALMKKGLLIESAASGKLPTPTRITRPLSSTMERVDKQRPRIGPLDAWNFLTGATFASAQLRWGSIENTVRAVAARKSTRVAAAAADDIGTICGLFEVFHTLRPYYPRPYLCLFDSLAFLHFLARYDAFPQWVYGVKLEPFAAHCWVQAGTSVINDTIDNVRDYTPIMAV